MKDDDDIISRTINEYIHGEAKGDARKLQVSGNNPHFKREDVVRALTNIQLTYKAEYTQGDRTNINTEGFKQALLNSLAKLDNVAIPHTLNQIDGRTIDFVEMLFGAFLRDPALSSPVKNLILKLQIPVIKTTLLDSRFFYKSDHPARKVLNVVAKLGIGIDDTTNTLYKTIELILDQLLQGFRESMASFFTALKSLERLEKIEQSKFSEGFAKTSQSITAEYARQSVLTELRFRLKDIQLSDSLKPFFLKQWSTLMLNVYLREGRQSDNWKKSVAILGILSDMLQPAENHEAWLTQKKQYSSIIDIANNALLGTKQDRDKISESIAALRNEFESQLENSPFKADIQEDETTAEIISLEHYIKPEAVEPGPDDQLESEAQDQMAMLPDYVRTGCWYELYSCHDNSKRRLKLSIIVHERACLIFVDRHGNRVLVKDAAMFAVELNNGKARMIEDKMLFESALSNVIQSISKKRSD